jgi:acyl-coenzyme A synthetase/AMP-(fatty) acid ligase
MNITDQILRNARTHPDMPALMGPRSVISYGQLEWLVRAGATWLAGAGLRAGDVIGVTIQSPIEHTIAVLSLAHLGATHVSISADTPGPLQKSSAKRAKIAGHITSSTATSELGVTHLPFDMARLAHKTAPIDENAACANPAAPLLMAIGSGTTGIPKIFAVNHAEAYQRFSLPPHTAISPGERTLSMMAVQFLSGTSVVAAGLLKGATSVFAPPPDLWENFPRIVNDFNITHIRATPMHAHQVVDSMRGKPKLERVRLFCISSARVDRTLRNAVAESVTGNVAVAYGTNETAIVAAAMPPLALQHPHAVGRPPDGVDLEIVDELDQPLPAGRTGLIRVRSPWMVRRYFDDAAATAHMFRNGWFYPGDLGELTADGLLFHHGRADDMMLYDGTNISPAEIERALLEHPAVLEAAAFPIRSERHQDIPAAAVTIRSPAKPDELTRFARERLGIRAPRILAIVSELPRNQMGKVLKAELSAEFGRRFPPPE